MAFNVPASRSRDDGVGVAEHDVISLLVGENSTLMDKDNMEKNLNPITNTSIVPPPRLTGMNIYANAMQEFDRIREAHSTLAPTGCSHEFCQSGRAAHVNEPRVGRGLPLAGIQQGAAYFLWECREHDVIKNDDDMVKRIREALVETLTLRSKALLWIETKTRKSPSQEGLGRRDQKNLSTVREQRGEMLGNV